MKRVDQVIDAFTAIAAERPEWDLLIVGQGPQEEELRQRVPADLRRRVKWLGFCDGDDMRLVYHCGHVNVLPSEYEPWGVVVPEAMTAGQVVVASDVVAAACEMVEDGVGGRLFRTGDLESLTEALRDVTDRENLERYRRASRPAVERWRRRSDPVEGVRRAMAYAGVIES